MAGKFGLPFMKQKEKGVFDKGDPSKLYDLLECLGEGTYGTVWTGTEKKTGRTCAVKIVKIDDDLPEIEQEISIMKDADSPYIVKFFGAYWTEKEKIWMVMEHCIAGSINDLMYVCGITLNIEQVRTTAAAITLGLKYLHKNLVIHRDIKAGNVLLTHEGHIRLADFGVSAKLKKPTDRTNTAIGAPFWMAPEVIREQYYDCKADVWSLGITVIELCEGRPPHSHLNAMKALFFIPDQPPPTLKDQNLPKDMHDFVRSCLIKNPKKRPTSKAAVQHMFIRKEAQKIETNDGKSEVMKNLVVSSLQKIEKWRKDEEDGETEAPKKEDTKTALPVSPKTQVDHKQSTLPDQGRTPLPRLPIQSEAITPVSHQFIVAPPPIPTQMMGSPPPPAVRSLTMKSNRSSFLNPSKDVGFRQSFRLNNQQTPAQAPLRDVAKPKKSMDDGLSFMNKDHQRKNMSAQQVTNILNTDADAEDNQVQAAVMTKEFITLLKSIYQHHPEAFENKAPKNWTGEDIAKAVVTALIITTRNQEQEKAGDISEAYKQGLEKKKAEEKAKEEEEEQRTERDLLEFINLGKFELGRDGDKIPPPPPVSLSEYESDLEI